MRRYGLGHEHVLERRAFARNLQGAVVIASLVLMMELDQQLLQLGVLVDDFLRQDEYAARIQPVRDRPDYRVAIREIEVRWPSDSEPHLVTGVPMDSVIRIVEGRPGFQEE